MVENITETIVLFMSLEKPFSDWGHSKLYEIGDGSPDLSSFPAFKCGFSYVNEDVLSPLMVELEGRLCSTPFIYGSELTISILLDAVQIMIS